MFHSMTKFNRTEAIQKLYNDNVWLNNVKRIYDGMTCRPIKSLFTDQDLASLTEIATKLRYAGRNHIKAEKIDAIMLNRGFRRLASGTNRICYYYLWDNSFIVKIGLDKIGMGDNISEYRVQHWLKPFCCKVFETTTNGILATIERVTSIGSQKEFYSIHEDVFAIIMNIISCRFIMEDIGTNFFKNWGVRPNFGPVLVDYPYCYVINPKRLHCTKLTEHGRCSGYIDYEPGFNYLCCEKCGQRYSAKSIGVSVEQLISEEQKQAIRKGELEMEKDFTVITVIHGKKYIKGVPYETYNMQNNTETSNKINLDKIDDIFIKDHIQEVVEVLKYENILNTSYVMNNPDYLAYRDSYMSKNKLNVSQEVQDYVRNKILKSVKHTEPVKVESQPKEEPKVEKKLVDSKSIIGNIYVHSGSVRDNFKEFEMKKKQQLEVEEEVTTSNTDEMMKKYDYLYDEDTEPRVEKIRTSRMKEF